MSALDQAFIKAYATAKPTPTPRAAAPADVAPSTAAPASPSAPLCAQPPHTSAPRVAAPMMDQLYADGTFYRFDAAAPSHASAVPVPHVESHTLGARRNARRLAHRAAVQAASITEPQALTPAAEQAEIGEPAAAPGRPQRRLWTRNVVEIARRLASDTVLDEENELSPEIVIQTPPKPLESTPSQPRPIDWPPGSPLNVVVQPTWDPQAAHWPSTPLTLFPESPEWLAGTIAGNVELDLAAMPEEPPARSARNFRLDAAHARPKPHKPPAKKIEKKVVEQVIAPEPIAPPKPPVPASQPCDAIEETIVEAVVEAVVEAPVAAPTSPSVGGTLKKPCVPVWEVDRFLWPLTCEKLLQDESYFAEAGEKLLAATRDGLKSLAITGSRRGEGRSTIALSLARSAARTGLSVAVVDADFARPQLAEMIGLEVSHSWEDAALGKIPLSEAAIKSLEDRITVLPLEASAAASSLSLADPRVTATLRALNATFDLVILDLGPLSPGSEPLFPAGEACPVDAAVVVRDLRYASPSETKAIGQRLHAAGLEAVGIAENFVSQEAAAAA